MEAGDRRLENLNAIKRTHTLQQDAFAKGVRTDDLQLLPESPSKRLTLRHPISEIRVSFPLRRYKPYT